MTTRLYQVLMDLANALNAQDKAHRLSIGVMNTATPPETATLQVDSGS